MWTLGVPGFLHRDYHGENLILVPGSEGLWRLGVLDFQDAHRGPPLYDLVSLIDDARRDVSPEVAAMVVQHWCASNSHHHDREVRMALAALGAQRATRILGVMARLSAQGRALPPAIGARVHRHLARALSHPALSGLQGWYVAHGVTKAASA